MKCTSSELLQCAQKMSVSHELLNKLQEAYAVEVLADAVGSMNGNGNGNGFHHSNSRNRDGGGGDGNGNGNGSTWLDRYGHDSHRIDPSIQRDMLRIQWDLKELDAQVNELMKLHHLVISSYIT